jgi:DNA-binding HxlR family transcriptional regulator
VDANCPAPDLRSGCPIAAALDLLGDRWTLLVLRDVLLLGKSRFQEFQESPEGISSNTLSERLERLERHGLLVREVYQDRPQRHRYVVTPKGRDLLPLLREAALWGMRHVPGTMQVPEEMLRDPDPPPPGA